MTSPSVLIDGYFLGKPYGFGRFIFELCRALDSAAAPMGIHVAVPVRPELVELPDYNGLTWHRMPDANFIVWEQVLIPRLARKLGSQLIHFPYNTRAVWCGGARTVTTVHDLIFLDEAVPMRKFKMWIVSQYARRVFKSATARSDAVISVSDTTRRALAALGIRATTVYNTIDGFLGQLPQPVPSATTRYFLHRGGYQPHRNTATVIQAFRKVRERVQDIELKIVGAPQGADRWGTSGDEGIHFLPRISDAALAVLYACSSCVVATSLQEGFGLPVIEGFGFGAPVITSDLDPMREIAGGAALLVDPRDVAGLAAAMVSVTTDATLAQSLLAKGRERMAAFASAHVAEQMISIYRSCLKR